MYGVLRVWGRAVVAGLVPVVLAVGFGGTASASLARSPAPATGQVCVPVRLTAVGQDLGLKEGVLHTQATVFLGHVPVATTYASFTPGTPTGSSAPFSGPIDFTPAVGTATVRGAVDLSSGKFTATSTALTGTGSLAGVSGRLDVPRHREPGHRRVHRDHHRQALRPGPLTGAAVRDLGKIIFPEGSATVAVADPSVPVTIRSCAQPEKHPHSARQPWPGRHLADRLAECPGGRRGRRVADVGWVSWTRLNWGDGANGWRPITWRVAGWWCWPETGDVRPARSI